MPARVWVFVPTYNEVENVERTVRDAVAVLEGAVPGEFRLLVVDDASPDGTGRLGDRLAAELEGVEVLHRAGKEGLGAAYRAGFRHAVDGGAELVLVMDADGSHDPAHLPALIDAAGRADLVIGSRYCRGARIADWGPWRRLISFAGSLYARTILRVDVRDLTGGFKGVRREVLERLDLDELRAQGYVFNIELTYRALLAGFRVEEVPIVFHDRRAGRSKMSYGIALEALKLIPSLRRSLRAQRGAAAPARDTAGV